MTAFHLAAIGGHLRVIQLLLKYGADVTAEAQEASQTEHLAAWPCSSHPCTATSLPSVSLCIASTQHWLCSCTVCTKHCWPSSADTTMLQGMTPLHFAARGGKDDVAEYLLTQDIAIDARTTQVSLAYCSLHTTPMYVVASAEHQFMCYHLPLSCYQECCGLLLWSITVCKECM